MRIFGFLAMLLGVLVFTLGCSSSAEVDNPEPDTSGTFAAENEVSAVEDPVDDGEGTPVEDTTEVAPTDPPPTLDPAADPAPSEEPAPATEEPAPATEEPAPATEEPAPATEEPAPAAE